MDWVLMLVLIVGGLIFFILAGLPVFAAFLLVDMLGFLFFMGGPASFSSLIRSFVSSIGVFTLVPVPLFILMGEIIFVSGMATRALDVIERILIRLPGRLGMVTIVGSALFNCLSGSALGTCAMFGSLLVPEMRKRNYSKYMSIGPIMAGSALAVVIPPSTLVIVLASQADLSIGRLLMAGLIPGLLLSFLFAVFIVIACVIKPSWAPAAKSETVAISDVAPSSSLFMDFLKYVFPLSLIVISVLGAIFSGMATPTEASALGGIASLFLALVYGALSWRLISRSLISTLNITTMIFMIVAASVAFSQLLAFTGITRGIVGLATAVDLAPMMVLAVILLIMVLMGTIIDQMSMIMIGVPMFMPVARALEFDPIWFGLLMLLCITLGLITPPFGLLLFIVKGVSPVDTQMIDIFYSILPYLILTLIGIALIFFFPEIALWLPRRM